MALREEMRYPLGFPFGETVERSETDEGKAGKLRDGTTSYLPPRGKMPPQWQMRSPISQLACFPLISLASLDSFPEGEAKRVTHFLP